MRISSAFSILALTTAIYTASGANPATGSQAARTARSSEQTPQPNEMMLAAGTVLHVRLNDAVDTKDDRAGRSFSASVTAPILSDGVTVVPAGSTAFGHVVESKASGRFKGRAYLTLRLDAVEVRGQRYAVHTASVSRATTGHKKRNIAMIGGGAGAGAAIGAIAGGGAGALIGAGAGAAAGTIGEAVTGKKQLRIPVETAMSFRLSRPVGIRM